MLNSFGPGPRVVDRVLRLYTITEGAADAPPGMPFAVREFEVGPGCASPRLGWVHWAVSLQAARELVPPAASYRWPRDDNDDPVIVETWL